jgi:hypothetical protein
MSEEKPTFKITDRRLFNPDGSPREIEREEEQPAPAAAEDATAAAATAVAGGAVPRPEAAAKEAEIPASSIDASGGTGAVDTPLAGGAATAETDDPQEFLMVVEFIASFAADALGMVEHPGAGRGDVNLPLAKQCIDMLLTLQRKTRGNLSGEEQQVFDLILSQLRMQFVRAADAARGQPPPSPRGFTGGDITGGR